MRLALRWTSIRPTLTVFADRLRPWCAAAMARPWFSYLTIFLLQLHVVWGAWTYRDLTSGDTAAYYRWAHSWCADGIVQFHYSPLYEAFYGSFLYLNPDVIWATLAHRLVIVFAASLLVLAVMRRLLPPAPAWLVAAWWAVLPINFNTLYEVHLFALLPILVAWWLMVTARGPWRRAGALAVLGASVILTRNEYLIAAVLLAFLCLGCEVMAVRRGTVSLGRQLRSVVPAYLTTITGAALVCGFFYVHAQCQGEWLQWAFRSKHTLNMGQVYAFGYQQRHPEWTDSPWTECHGLMQQTFGERRPTLGEMVKANPRAVAEHFLWNLRLAPAGLQVLLFNVTSGKINPDYALVKRSLILAVPLSLLVLGIWVAGLRAILQRRRFWWTAYLRARAPGWLAMAAVSVVAVPIILTQRPRPSYLFGLGVSLMAVTGMCAFVLARRVGWLRRTAVWMPLVMIGLCIAVPSYFRTWHKHDPRTLCRLVERLRPYQELIAPPDTVRLQGEFGSEVGLYLGNHDLHAYDYHSLLRVWSAGVPFDQQLRQEGINLLYLDDGFLSLLEHERAEDAQHFLSDPADCGWERVAAGDAPGDRWRLFRRIAFPVGS